jgi:hypothetical protein
MNVKKSAIFSTEIFKRVSFAIAKINSQTFSLKNVLVISKDAFFVMEAAGHQNDPTECRLFIHASKFSFKAVLLHNRNKFHSVPPAHLANMKESYENMRLDLEKIKHEKYNWNICGGLKVIAFLLGLELGYTRFCGFCVNETVGTENIITCNQGGLCENRFFQDRKMQ